MGYKTDISRDISCTKPTSDTDNKFTLSRRLMEIVVCVGNDNVLEWQ
jgi:hypothetical protein